MGENGKGGPLGEMEDIEDFEDLGGRECARTLPFPSTIVMRAFGRHCGDGFSQ